MMPSYVTCVDCGRPVNPQHDYKEVTGWERPRKKGLNALYDRRETGTWIHRDCYDLRRLRGQTSLL